MLKEKYKWRYTQLLQPILNGRIDFFLKNNVLKWFLYIN